MNAITTRPVERRQPLALPWAQRLWGLLAALVPAWLLFAASLAHAQGQAQGQEMMVRISEIQVHAEHLAQYKAILAEEAEASVRLEPGVIAIFPMFERDSDTEFRILEMYADRRAYEAHLKTPHFLKYKSATLHMVKSLKLVDMQAIDRPTMNRMFTKMGSR
ncbi:antibiotic biosynthesis monooxygenase [Pseudoduganella sp. SL102]|uniref:putative quinol monooxygenase n=1 Tax=Pseudoduganella sp. SL102 TaxID=2995154 RepID=UPI00248ABEDB|nr:antibiotic biosynthesis monooxygenase [Pseudoduganella sp. SL102]WBS04084.1 antibiotic biosynthesis monooxygenase [Pseudoduganella sp. SL102]